LIVLIFLMRANAASMEIGAGSSSSMTSPSTSSFSNCPRGGSFMKKARIATSATGMPSRYQAQRHPSGAAGPHRDRGDEDRAHEADRLRAHVHRSRHPGPDADGVVIGEQ